jgi:hypothetical protein
LAKLHVASYIPTGFPTNFFDDVQQTGILGHALLAWLGQSILCPASVSLHMQLAALGHLA